MTDADGSRRRVDYPAAPDSRWAPSTCGGPPVVAMGAYESQDSCYISDMKSNGDGAINPCDIQPFLECLTP